MRKGRAKQSVDGFHSHSTVHSSQVLEDEGSFGTKANLR